MIYIGIGSNLGNRTNNIEKAKHYLIMNNVNIIKSSGYYETLSWPDPKKPKFYNIILQSDTKFSPKKLLNIFKSIEKKLGRKIKPKNSPRECDIDLIAYKNKVFKGDISIPHSRMHLRNFILVPFVEIAPQWKHPLLKKTILELLKNSTDKDILEHLPFQRWSPPIFDTFSHIIIEGNIGVGKTTLAQKIAIDYKLSFLQESFAKNPYLEKFYKDPLKYSLAVERFFLKDRIEQTNGFWNQNRGNSISDYNIQKSLIFARQNLNDKDFNVYKKQFDMSYTSQNLPDLMVYLHTDIKTLQTQIKKRGRPFEQQIKNEYLEKIERGYQKFIQSDLPYPVVSISTKNLNFETNKADYQTLLRLIFEASFS